MPGKTFVPVHDAVAEPDVAVLVHREAPIQRWIPSFGAYVDCCLTLYVPSVLRISYQRTPACGLVGDPALTDWFVTSASYLPKLR